MNGARKLAVCFVVLLASGAGSGCDGTQRTQVPLHECVKEFPRANMSPIASADAIRQAITECQGDDGDCRARTACVGTPPDRTCQADAFITADAALCVANSNGLQNGLERLRTSLVYDYAFRRVTWSVSNVTYDGARGVRPEGGGTRGGRAFAVDAVDARVLNQYDWTTTP